MTRSRPGGPPSPEMMKVLLAYEAGELSAHVAAERFTDLLEQAKAPVNFSPDRPLQEALLNVAIARGRVPPYTKLDPDA